VVEDIHAEIRAVYEQVDREVAAAGPVCVASGRCCRFKEYGHVLFVSNLEASVLLDQAPAYETPVSSEFCPFQQDKLCTARGPRPLGCRIYYCDPAYQSRANEITEKYLAQLKEIARRRGLSWCYAPLHRFLNDPQAAQLST
jgi:hypothetical protein